VRLRVGIGLHFSRHSRLRIKSPQRYRGTETEIQRRHVGELSLKCKPSAIPHLFFKSLCLCVSVALTSANQRLAIINDRPAVLAARGEAAREPLAGFRLALVALH